MGSYKIGDYGEFEFIEKRRGYKRYFKLHATVQFFDDKQIKLKDNEGYPYMPFIKDIKKFIPKKKTV